MVDAYAVRKDFPIYSEKREQPFVYLDSTATALKPHQVIDAVNGYYSRYSANVFRGIYGISEEATAAYEDAREQVATFIHASSSKEVVFTRNASESLNLLLYAWARDAVSGNDEIVTTVMEHHSNFVPWQQLAHETGCAFTVCGVTESYDLDYNALADLVTKRTKLVAVTGMSNVLGTLVDIPRVVHIARSINPSVTIVVDAAQTAPHVPLDVQALGVDFVAFSGHKMLGPTGIGVLWGKSERLAAMHPFLYGGDMISEVHEKETIFNEIPHKFEAGTPHIAGVIGLGAAVRYLSSLGMDNVRNHEEEITAYAIRKLREIPGLTMYGPSDTTKKGGVIAFTLKGIHPHDIAQILDQKNICIRVGFHCAQPLHEACIGSPTARASFYIYTTREDIDALESGIRDVQRMFA